MQNNTSYSILDLNTLLSALPKRERSAHKGDFGHVLVIGGNYGFAGAARMAGEAALRVGAGLVSVATRAEHVTSINSSRPELMVHAISEPDILNPLITKASVIALGPGLGQCAWAQQLFEQVIKTNLPLVVDADALHLLSRKKQHSEHWILTPHPGEAAALLKTTIETVQANRVDTVKQLQDQFGGIVILKGYKTLICNQKKQITLCPYGNPGMATGGMGDILTGIIAGLLAQHLISEQACNLGVCAHAAAADHAALSGERGLIATDLFIPLRTIINGIPL